MVKQNPPWSRCLCKHLKGHSGIVLTDRVARDTHIGILAAVVSHDGAGGPVYALCATSDSPDSLYFDLIAKKLCSPAIAASHHEHLGTYTGIAFDTRGLSDLVSDAVSHVVERAAAKILAANERFRASLDPPLNDSHGGMFFCLHAEELPIPLV
jgi:hypothetical protein